jgi:hypothetical protein
MRVSKVGPSQIDSQVHVSASGGDRSGPALRRPAISPFSALKPFRASASSRMMAGAAPPTSSRACGDALGEGRGTHHPTRSAAARSARSGWHRASCRPPARRDPAPPTGSPRVNHRASCSASDRARGAHVNALTPPAPPARGAAGRWSGADGASPATAGPLQVVPEGTPRYSLNKRSRPPTSIHGSRARTGMRCFVSLPRRPTRRRDMECPQIPMM